MSRFAILAPLAPALVITAYFVVAFAIFLARASVLGMRVDQEVEKRSASPLLGRFLRHYMMWLLGPWERALAKTGISPNTITLASLGSAAGSAVAIGFGHFALGGWLYLLTGILDILDGRVARRTDRVTRGGAYFDSVIDRYAELLVFSGFAFYYRNSWALAVVLAAAIGSIMVSYAKARGESLGVDVNVGTMQRPERLFYLGLMTTMAPIVESLYGHGTFPSFVLAVVALGLLAASANWTAARRISHTLARLDEAEGVSTATPPKPAPEPTSTTTGTASAMPLRILRGGR